MPAELDEAIEALVAWYSETQYAAVQEAVRDDLDLAQAS
jgi:hypothetical protein